MQVLGKKEAKQCKFNTSWTANTRTHCSSISIGIRELVNSKKRGKLFKVQSVLIVTSVNDSVMSVLSEISFAVPLKGAFEVPEKLQPYIVSAVVS